MAKASNVGRKPNGEPCNGSELPQIVDRYRLFKQEKGLSGSNRTGFLISPSSNDLTSRLDVDAFWKGDAFDVLSNDHIKIPFACKFKPWCSTRGDKDALHPVLQNPIRKWKALHWTTLPGISRATTQPACASVSGLYLFDDNLDYRLIGVKMVWQRSIHKRHKGGKSIKAAKAIQSRT